MTNIAGVPAFGGGGFAYRQPPDPPKPAVPEVAETALNGAATYTKGHDLPGQNGYESSYAVSEPTQTESASTDQTTRALQESYEVGAPRPEDVLTGPTPAFQASVLEVELDLRYTIAKLAAKRSQATDEEAIAATRVEAKQETREATPANQPTEPAVAATEDVTAVRQVEETAKAQTEALTAVPSEATDPETLYAGPAAIVRTPYDQG